ncbi:MAG: 50S ribosomal protein L17 [Phycisphaerales bacterium]|nr:MAG: 50S ribosomal protein L17 [Phycisphaerales bacterium]
MRHRISKKKLNRTSAHRRAMQRNLAQSLFEHGRVRTTLAKAKDIRPFAEKLITLGKKARAGSQTARRRLHKLLSDRSMIPAEHREAYDMMSGSKRAAALRYSSGRRYRSGKPKGRLAFTAESITYRLVNTIAAKYEDRDGGYTRIIRLARPRVGDHGPQAVVQLVGDEQSPGPVAKPEKTARRRRADARYAFAVKTTRSAAKTDKGTAKKGKAGRAGQQAETAKDTREDDESAET